MNESAVTLREYVQPATVDYTTPDGDYRNDDDISGPIDGYVHVSVAMNPLASASAKASRRDHAAPEQRRKCFEIDPNWRLHALEDGDLKPLWQSFETLI